MKRNSIKIVVKRILGFFSVFYLLIGLLVYLFQEKLMFHPKKLDQKYEYQFNSPFEEVFLKTKDGAMINALHFKEAGSKGVILYFHGNAGNLNRWGSIGEEFTERNYDVFIIDYRTYGKSTGERTEENLLDDAEMSYNYLLKYYSPDQITIYGRSLGTNFATFVASRNKAKQLILEAPFFSFVDMAQRRFPLLPTKQLLKFKMLTNQYIENVKCPITFFHGKEDQVVPYDSGRNLYDIAPEGHKEMVTIPDANHNNISSFQEYQAKLDQIL